MSAATTTPVQDARAAAEYLVREGYRLAIIADKAGLKGCGDSCHQLRLRAERFIAEQGYRGPRR